MRQPMRSVDTEQIRALSLFHEMTELHFEDLMRVSFFQRFPAHVVLIREGQIPDFLHVVVEGEVELYAGDDDRETTIEILPPVTTFILAAVILDKVYLKSARTLALSRILMIPAEAVRTTFCQDVAFALAIVRELSIRYRNIVRALKNQKLRIGTERLAAWILQRDCDGSGRVELPYEKQTLAALLGMVPPSLSRRLATLTNCITTDLHGITIKDRNSLAHIARPNPLIDEEP